MSNVPANVTNTSNSYNYAPSTGELVLYSYGMCGVRRTELTQQHFEDARMACNMVNARWSADGVNLWQVDLQVVQLVQGVPTYQVPDNTIVILDGYFTISNGTTNIDRIMLPISRTEYASYPNKLQQGSPTVFWMDRLLSPTVTLWPCPNGQQAYFKYYRLRQTQDSNLSNGQNSEIPFYFLEAYAQALGYRLALIWAPERAPVLKTLADESWGIASKQNVETSNLYITPVVNGYWRQ